MSMMQTGSVPARHQLPGNRRILILFLALAYGLSWAVWGMALAQQAGWID